MKSCIGQKFLRRSEDFFESSFIRGLAQKGNPLKLKHWRMFMHFKSNNMFGRVLASSVVALLASTSLYAIPKGPCDAPAPDACCDEPKPGPFGFAFPMDMQLSCPRDFYVRVDGLAFQAKQDGMEFALIDTNGSGSGPITHGRVEGFSNDHTDWDYNPGVRVGIGFFLDHDAWNLDFTWTWLNITDYKHANATTSGGVAIPQWILGAGTPAAQIGTRSSAVWDADYDTIDLRLGKPFHISRYVVFNPHFGARIGWIDQHFSCDYNGTGNSTRTIHHADNDFWGVGARAGIDTDWILGKGWCLFGNISGSMLFGRFEIDQNMTIPTGSSADGFDIKYDFYQNVPNFEMALGIGWGQYFDNNRYHVALRAAYEFVEWFDQLNLRKFSSGSTGISGGSASSTGSYANDTVSRGNLTLNGFSFRVQLDI